MAIETIHSFLVHPSKNEDESPDIGGTPIPLRGRLKDMLTDVFNRAADECNIEVIFRPNEENKPINECRDLLIDYLQAPDIDKGRVIAKSLQDNTTRRSGLGLLFLMKGVVADQQALVISRFPADQGIIAKENAQNLSVSFVEEVFMKSAKAYKSAYYTCPNVKTGFWDGKAIDRQISGPRELSEYWIRDFLQSELRTTGPAGTKRLAIAIRDAIRTHDLAISQELIAATGLLRSKHGQSVSARQIVQQYGLTPQAATALEESFVRPELMDEVFQFDLEEFDKHAYYRSIELDNGGIIMAEDAHFEEIFERSEVEVREGEVRYTTEGRIVNERLRKTK